MKSLSIYEISLVRDALEYCLEKDWYKWDIDDMEKVKKIIESIDEWNGDKK